MLWPGQGVLVFAAVAAVVLLAIWFAFALRRRKPDDLRPALRWVVRALPWSPLAAIGAYVLWLWLAHNWAPPKMLERAFLERSTQHTNQAMTETLNSKFPPGTDEAVLKSALLEQGFADAQAPPSPCRSSETAASPASARCADETREMRYDIQSLGLVCGTTHLFVDWSVDHDGKIARLEASERFVCW